MAKVFYVSVLLKNYSFLENECQKKFVILRLQKFIFNKGHLWKVNHWFCFSL
jgi:hypothetical protein